MSTYNIYFIIKSENFPKIPINICILGLSREKQKNKIELAIIKEPSVFELLRFYCSFTEN